MGAVDATVVIPTRSRWSKLSTTLALALDQVDVAYEVVVVDDGSTDETPERLAALGDPRVRTVRHEQSRGVAAARNSGIAEARGEWVAFLDDDDLWAPRRLRSMLDAARAADAVLTYTAVVVVDEHLDVIEVVRAPDPHDILRLLLVRNAIPATASNIAVRADVLRHVGGFDESLQQLADWELCMRVAERGPGAACDEPLLAYVQHPEAMLLTDTGDLRAEFDRIARKHSDVARKLGVEIDRPGLSRWMAWGYSRAGRRFAAARGYGRAALGYAARRRRWMATQSARDAFLALRGEVVSDRGTRARPARAPAPDWLQRFRDADAFPKAELLEARTWRAAGGAQPGAQ
jgi:glycosyltransferase involved in cell wall biosynthesis